MLSLLQQGEIALFALVAFALVASLTFHEFGHAYVAKRFGDDTAQLAGRLTLNPLRHIDVMGFLMVVLIGFGYAKPVPTDPRKFTSRFGDLWVSAAGPAMNLILAVLTWNLYLLLYEMGGSVFTSDATFQFFFLLARVNLLLMVFNLIPIAPLDGHYILPYALPREVRPRVMYYNRRFGPMLLLGLIALNFVGFPVLTLVLDLGNAILPMISWLGDHPVLGLL